MLQRTAVGSEFRETPEARRVLISLEYFLSDILSKVYPYWKEESFDGFRLLYAKKIDWIKVELVGVCVLISDQTVTPFHLELQISTIDDKIDWLECGVGKRGHGTGDMERTPYRLWRQNPFIALGDASLPIDWVYKIGFGPGGMATGFRSG